MQYPDLALDKCWVKQSESFRFATIVVLGMSITDSKLLNCLDVSEVNKVKKISLL